MVGIFRLLLKMHCKIKDLYGVENLSINHGDFFNMLDQSDHAVPHVLVSNPPYISEDAFAQLDDIVKREPKTALVADERNGRLSFLV